MYKVFVNDSLICLSDNYAFLTDKAAQPFNKSIIIYQIENLEQNSPQELLLFSENLESDWNEFRSALIVKTAGGGKVFNAEGAILFIKRLGRWDLPKGHLEKGETAEEGAIREVEEECGISGLEIISELPTTYHIFRRKGKLILKETYWFEMKTDFKGELVPQIEEDITEARFLDEKMTAEALQNTYKNIQLLF